MASTSPLPVMVDLDALPIPGQQGWAVLDLNGQLVRNNNLGDHDASILFQMLQESTPLCQAGGGLQRLTVTFAETRYLVTRDETHVYLVQTRAA